ncbi:MAG: cysteine desulfurase [Opitutaceae bacterium]|jgi:cysteine desulfurase/selenocysteine lyase
MITNWGRIRDAFPTLNQKVNGHPLVYLDSAATTQKPLAVLESLRRFYVQDNANVHRGIHALSMRATDAYEAARARTARFINAEDPAEIVFTRGTTEGINLVAASWCAANLKKGDVVLLTEMEHHSNLVPWQMAAWRSGATLRFVPVAGGDAEHGLDMAALDTLLTPEVKLFAFTHISNTLGIENPVAELCARARRVGALTLVDAAQSIGHQIVDVQAIGCDFLAFSGHKMAGPTGIGVLYGRKSLLNSMPPWQTGGGMISSVDFFESRWKPAPERFEAGTPNVADAVGLAAAMEFLDSLDRGMINAHDRELAAYACNALSNIPGIRILGPRPGQPRTGLVSFSLKEAHAHDVVTFADQDGLALRGGHHCNQPLMKKLGLTSTSRASFYIYNTEEDVDRLVSSLLRIAKFFGGS